MRFEVREFSYDSIFPSSHLLNNESGYGVWDSFCEKWYRAKGQPLKILDTKAEAMEYLQKIQDVEPSQVMKATEILWDVENQESLQFLPTEITIPAEVIKLADEDDESISDYITNVSGFCHKGFKLSEVAE